MLLFNRPPLCADHFPQVSSSLLFHTCTVLLFLQANVLFFKLLWPQYSHHNGLLTLLCSISIWHSFPNCPKLGLQPLLHPISRGAEGFLLLIISQGSEETAMVQTHSGAQVAARRLEAGPRRPHWVTRHVCPQLRGQTERQRWTGGSDGDKANYFHLWAAPCQQTCNLKRSQWSAHRLWALGESMVSQMRLWQRVFGGGPFTRIPPAIH